MGPIVETIVPKVDDEDELSGAAMQKVVKPVSATVPEEDSDDEVLCPPTPEKEGGAESCPVAVSEAIRKL